MAEKSYKMQNCFSADNSSYVEIGGLVIYDIDELMQERRNSIANTLELHLSCTNPLIY